MPGGWGLEDDNYDWSSFGGDSDLGRIPYQDIDWVSYDASYSSVPTRSGTDPYTGKSLKEVPLTGDWSPDIKQITYPTAGMSPVELAAMDDMFKDTFISSGDQDWSSLYSISGVGDKPAQYQMPKSIIDQMETLFGTPNPMDKFTDDQITYVLENIAKHTREEVANATEVAENRTKTKNTLDAFNPKPDVEVLKMSTWTGREWGSIITAGIGVASAYFLNKSNKDIADRRFNLDEQALESRTRLAEAQLGFMREQFEYEKGKGGDAINVPNSDIFA